MLFFFLVFQNNIFQFFCKRINALVITSVRVLIFERIRTNLNSKLLLVVVEVVVVVLVVKER